MARTSVMKDIGMYLKRFLCFTWRTYKKIKVNAAIFTLFTIGTLLLLIDTEEHITLHEVMKTLNDTPCIPYQNMSYRDSMKGKISDAILSGRKKRLNVNPIPAYRVNGDQRTITYLNYPNNICDRQDKNIVLFVAVFVNADDFSLRKYIRATWGTAARQNPKIRLMFLLGIPPTSYNTSSEIRRESACYQDLLQMDFIDKYRNLTLKSLSMYRWVRTKCRQAKFVLKIDSDASIDLNYLVKVLEEDNLPSCFLCGCIFVKAPTNRKSGNDWFVSEEQWELEILPHYCLGAAFVVPRRIATKLSLYPALKEPFPVDDMFVTGIWRLNNKECFLGDFLYWTHHKGKIVLPNGYGIAEVTINKHLNGTKTNLTVCK